MEQAPESAPEIDLAYGQICLQQGDALGAYTAFARAARHPEQSLRARGLNMLGRYYHCGWGGAPDAAKALHYFTRAAALGDAWALFNIGDLYAQDPQMHDPDRAFAHYAKAAELGLPKAQTMVGLAYEEGQAGLAQDPSRARAFYAAAAEGGDCWGHYHLGRLAVAQGDLAAARRAFAASLPLGHKGYLNAFAQAIAGQPALADLRERALRQAEGL